MEKEKVILGENCCYSADSNETGLNNNVIVCGGSGSGKTMSVSEPRLLETKTSSMIATVTKRRIVNKYMLLFKKTLLLEMELQKHLPMNMVQLNLMHLNHVK